jgi:uncharacterized protein (TIGR02271 family)
MTQTVVGLMDTPREAESVVRDLTSSCGCDRSDIGLMARGPQDETGTRTTSEGSGEVGAGALKGAGTGAAIGGVLGLVAGAASLAIPGFGPIIAAGPIAAGLAGAGIGAVTGGVIGALTKIGVPEDEAHYYAEGVRRGGTLITLHARDERMAQCAAQVMRQHGAIDIDQRAEQWRQEGWTGRAVEGERVIPVTKEELSVGKREVSRGGVRVYAHTIERPVQETVPLREERATIERRPVDRPAASSDEAFKERSIEVSETAEEPVVGKRARVTEEVRVGKRASQRQQTVRDTVRQTEVQVDKAGSGAGTQQYQGPERRRAKSPYAGAERRMAVR